MNMVPWRDKRERTGGIAGIDTALSRFRDEVDGWFERFFRDPGDLSALSLPGSAGGPRMDLAESDDAITVKAELPGVDPKDIEISVTGNRLTLRGEKKQDREERGRDYHYVERQYGGFHRSIQLPTSVDSTKVSAEYKNGIVTVTLAKNPGAKAKRIPVRNA